MASLRSATTPLVRIAVARHLDPTVDGHREAEPAGVVGVVADQVHSPRGAGDDRLPLHGAVTIRGTVVRCHRRGGTSSPASRAALTSGTVSLMNTPECCLHAGADLEAVGIAMRGQELDVEVPVVGACGRLLDAHHVGEVRAVQRVVARDDVVKGAGEVDYLGVAEVTEAPETVRAGSDVDLEGPSGREGHGDGEHLVGDDLAIDLLGDERAAEAARLLAPVRLVLGDLVPGRWGQVSDAVELAVQVIERGSDRAAAVLERHDVVVALVPQLARPLPEHGDELDQLRPREVGEGVVGVVRRVDDHLGASERGTGELPGPGWCLGRQRREAVVEHGHLEGPGQLQAARAQWARTVLGPSHQPSRPGVAARRDEHPRPGEPVEAPVEQRRVTADGSGLSVEGPRQRPVDVELAAVRVHEVVAHDDVPLAAHAHRPSCGSATITASSPATEPCHA